MFGRILSKLTFAKEKALEKPDRVFHIRISGQIDSSKSDLVLKNMKKLSGLKAKLIGVSVDSSQGSLVHAEIIADLLRGKAKELKCPLYTFAESAALGSGYLILSCGDKVFADPHSLIGGISASYHSVSLVNAAKMLKVKQTTISTSEVRVSPFEVLKEADEEWVKKILSFQDSALKEAILNYRSQVSNNEEAWKGEVFLGKKAVENGLADCVADFTTVALEEFPNIKVTSLSMKRFVANSMIRNWSQKILVGKVLEEISSETEIDGVQFRSLSTF